MRAIRICSAKKGVIPVRQCGNRIDGGADETTLVHKLDTQRTHIGQK